MPTSTDATTATPLRDAFPEGSQLQQITDDFDARGIKHWLNSGTLLGLVRDNRLIRNDPDIDVGAWWEDRHRILETVAGWKTRKIQTWQLGDSIYKIKVFPEDRPHARMIDIDLFRKHGEYGWCPQFAPRGLFERNSSARRIVRHSCRKIATFFLDRNGHHLSNHLGLRLVHDVYTWWAPLRFLDSPELRTFEYGEFRVPQDPEIYLEYRYGDWREPDDGWSFLDDDRGLIHEHPRNLVA